MENRNIDLAIEAFENQNHVKLYNYQIGIIKKFCDKQGVFFISPPRSLGWKDAIIACIIAINGGKVIWVKKPRK